MTDIVVEQRISAPPETVYRYLTDAELWARWQGESAHHDARPGGLFSMFMPDGMNARGQFVELVPNAAVSFTWGWVGREGIPPGSTMVKIELEPTTNGTLLTLTHTELPDDESELHTEGWRHHLTQLADILG